MTALDEVLKAEEMAKETVEAAKETASKAVEEAKAEQQSKLEEEKKSLAEAAEASTANEETRVKGLADSIVSEFDGEVKAVEQRFEAKKDSLKATIKKRFQ